MEHASISLISHREFSRSLYYILLMWNSNFLTSVLRPRVHSHVKQ